jgi:hypothetical protein
MRARFLPLVTTPGKCDSDLASWNSSSAEY